MGFRAARPARPTGSRTEAYLDAARSAVLDLGWRRTTLTEVARRAQVSRMTIYRSWPDMSALLSDLMTREARRVGAEVLEDRGTDPDPGSIATSVVAVSRGLRENDLFRRIVEVDPQMLLPYLLERAGRTQQALVAALGEMIRDGQAAGTVRDGDPEVLARVVTLAGHGLALSAGTMCDENVSVEDLDVILGDIIRAGLEA